MTKNDYVDHVRSLLEKENIEPRLKMQILETVTELLEYYSVDFVLELLPTLFKI